MEQSDRDLLRIIEIHAREACQNHDPAHDASHVQRVVANARRILGVERDRHPAIDDFVVLAACWLHDVIQLPKGAGPRGESARQSAQHARTFLASLGLDDLRAEQVASAVGTHSYSGGELPATLEAGIVQDADRLDALGAIGIARLWVVAGKMESQLCHPTDPMARERPLDDARYALDHIAAKLLNLPDLMNTPTGRELAQQRASYLISYRDQFLDELGE
ncbi:HD domain-containing protein [soil metagenome]